MLLSEKVSMRLGDRFDRLLATSRKVRIHENVMDAAFGLVATSGDKIPALAKYTCWPDYKVWLESQPDSLGRRFGFLYLGWDIMDSKGEQGTMSVRTGSGFVFMEYQDGHIKEIPVRIDLESYDLKCHQYLTVSGDKFKAINELVECGISFEEASKEWATIHQRTKQLAAESVPVLEQIKPIMFSILALMNSPKLIHYQEPAMSRQQRKQFKKGKYPFHPHHEIRLNIDKHVLNVRSATGEGTERGQYFVRAHLRFLVHPRYKNVSVTLVEPHYRGNPEIGMRNTSYAVERQNSTWPVE